MFRRRAHDQPERAPAGTRYLLREKMLTFGDDFWIENDTRALSAAPDSRRTGAVTWGTRPSRGVGGLHGLGPAAGAGGPVEPGPVVEGPLGRRGRWPASPFQALRAGAWRARP